LFVSGKTSGAERWLHLNTYNAFIYPNSVPNACGFWLSLWVFIDSYELALKEAVAADGQQVAVFHSRLCPNIHTNYLTVSKNFP